MTMVSGLETGDAPQSAALELSTLQASLAFERALLGFDQILMSAIRTSLSLITFGFAMVLFFHQMGGQVGVSLHVPARNFGLSLVAMGIGLVTFSLIEHRRRFDATLARMEELCERKLLPECGPHRRPAIAVIALLLLLSGVLVMLGIVVRIGPFG